MNRDYMNLQVEEIQQIDRKFNRESLERLDCMSSDFYHCVVDEYLHCLSYPIDVDGLHVMIDMVGQFRFILDSLVDIPEKPVVIDCKSKFEHLRQLLQLSSQFHRFAHHEYEHFLGFHPLDVDNLHVMADMIDQLRSVLNSLVCVDD